MLKVAKQATLAVAIAVMLAGCNMTPERRQEWVEYFDKVGETFKKQQPSKKRTVCREPIPGEIHCETTE